MNARMTTDPWQGAGPIADDRTVHIPPRGAYGPPPRVDTHAPFAGGGSPVFAGQTWSAAPTYPPAPWPMTAPAPRRRAIWPFAAAGVALVATLVGVTVLATRGDAPAADTSASASSVEAAPTSEAPAAVVPDAALTALLLSIPEVATVSGSATVAGAKDLTDRIYQAMDDASIVDADCVSMLPAMRVAYQGSGYTSSRQQFLSGVDPERQIDQAVVSFPSAAAASKYVEATKAKWEKCANRSVNMRSTTSESGTDKFWTVGEVRFDNDILSSSRMQEGAGDWTCQSGLAARNNVVIDLYVCGSGVDPSVVSTFVDKVRTKIDGAH